MRAVLILAAGVIAALVSPLAAAGPDSDVSYVPLTAAEKSQTLPLVKLVLATHKSGDFASLCGVWSQRVVGARADPQFKSGSRLEIRFIQERGRWVLTNVLEYGSGR